MKLYAKCPNCKSETKFRSEEATRVEYVMKNGKTVQLNCQECTSLNKFHINDVYTKESKLALIIAGLTFFLGSVICLLVMMEVIQWGKSGFAVYAIAQLLLIPSMIYLIVQKQDLIRVKSFNQTYVNGTDID